MRQTAVVLACCVVFTAALAAKQGTGSGQAQGTVGTTRVVQTPAGPPPTLVAEVQTMFNSLKRFISTAADQFPEEKYEWKPTPDVRTMGGLLGHIVDDNNGACFQLAGDTERPARLDQGGQPTDAGKGLKKADIVKHLAESFARCDKAFAAVTPENMMERMGTNNNRSKIGALIYNTQHISDHYGNIVTYMRLQSMVPPSSAPRGGRGGF